MKKLMLLVFVLFCTSAVANPVEDKFNNTINVITTWASDEKAKTIAYQKKGWADGKAQLAKNWLQIKNLFNWTE